MARVYELKYYGNYEQFMEWLQDYANKPYTNGGDFQTGTVRAVWDFLSDITGTVNLNGLGVSEFEHFDALREAYDLDPVDFQPDDLEAVYNHLQDDDYKITIYHNTARDYYAVITLEAWEINSERVDA